MNDEPRDSDRARRERSVPDAPASPVSADSRRAADHQAASLLRPEAPRTDRHRRAPWITVAGGKGGVGKTLLSVNLAVLCARSGRRTLLVDFDPGLANVGVHLRLAPRHDLADLAAGLCTPAEALVDGPCGLKVLCGRSGDPTLAGSGARDAELAVRRALASIEAAASAMRADVVIVDTGAGIGPAVMLAAARATVTLCVTNSEPAALTDAYALIKVLHQEQPRARPALVINSVHSRDEAMSVAGRLQQVTRRFLGFEPAIAGSVRLDPTLASSIAEQRPAALGTGRAVDDLRALFATALSFLPTTRTRPGAADEIALGDPPVPRRVRLGTAPLRRSAS